MEVQIIQIDENTWRIEDGGVRFFLLTGTDKALLIDSGMNTPDAKEIARSLTDLPLELLNTHADRDHVAGNAAFPWFYMHPAEGSNYYHGPVAVGQLIPVWDGDVLDLGGRKLEVIHIPGHTPGSIALLDIDKRVLYSGDSVQDGNIFMFGVQREFHAYAVSLARLEDMMDRFDVVYPSHSTFPVEKSLIPALKEAAEKMLRGELPGRAVEIHGHDVMLRDAGAARFLTE
ncbi:MAG: MBL fold metallo-hydrolase [Lachnospiraceae bacterium]|nr:MBL fold metallo-hydrolase [Lachnospiraceae bacterium]